MSIVTTLAELDDLYGAAVPASITKEIDYISAEYARYIEASPFVTLATVGPEGLDCSPRGDTNGFVRIQDEKTVMMPDRPGNNRIDSLRNIVRDPRVALLFLIPGSGNTMRINGRARIDTAPALRDSFAVDGKVPRSVIVVAVERVYVQCARAVIRADLWNAARHVDPDSLPSIAQMLGAIAARQAG